MGSVNSNHSHGKISTVLIHIWQMGNWGTAWLLISVHSDSSLPLVISGCVTWTLQLQTETTAPSFLVGKMPSTQSVASRQSTGALGELRAPEAYILNCGWETEPSGTRPAECAQVWVSPQHPTLMMMQVFQAAVEESWKATPSRSTYSAAADGGAPGGGSSHQSLLKKLHCLKHMVCWVPGTSFPTAFGSWNFGIKACYS